tara:strand:- start:107 stop:280 length:174 start_codon:yes stop_codon:yes gene_type:complete
MDTGDILSRLEVITDKIEYEELDLKSVYDSLIELISDIEYSSDYDADFGNIRFDDLD